MRYNKQDIFEVYGWTDLDTYTHICVDARVLSHFSYVQLCTTLCHTDRGVTRPLCPWVSTGKNTGVGCHSLFQGIFLT